VYTKPSSVPYSVTSILTIGQAHQHKKVLYSTWPL